MKIFCTETICNKKPKGYAICTALMDVKDCPKREKEGEPHEKNSKTDSDLSMQS